MKIYRNIEGVEEVVSEISSKQASHRTAVMGADEVRVGVTVDSALDLKEGDYIQVDGVNYTLNRDAECTIASDVNLTYEMVFEHPFYMFLNKLFTERMTGSSTFFLTGTLRDFVEMVVWNINRTEQNELGVDTGWSVGFVEETEYRNMSFVDIDCKKALDQLAEEFEVEYRFENKTVIFEERIERITDYLFEQGKGKGLYSVTQQNVDKEDTVTRLYVRGGKDNILSANADEEGYLKLPENFLEDFSEHSRIVERKMKFEDEFPKFVGQAATAAGEVNEIITCPEIDFDIAVIAIGDNARINFLTGDLMGISFQFQWDYAQKKITLIPQEDETAASGSDGEKPSVPNILRKAKVGDKFNFTGILMPQSYVDASIARLREKGRKRLDFFARKRVKYSVSIDHRYLRGKPELKAGDLVVLYVPQKGLMDAIRITQLDKNLHTGAIEATISNYLEHDWGVYLEDRINAVKNQIVSSHEKKPKDGEPGKDAKYIELSGKSTLKNAGRPGGDNATTITAVKHGFEGSVGWQWLSSAGSWQVTGWSTDSVTVDYSLYPGIFINDVCTLKCHSLADPAVFKTISINVIRDGDEGEDAKYIELTGNTVLKNPHMPDGVKSTTITATLFGIGGSVGWEYRNEAGTAWSATPWFTHALVVDYAQLSSIFYNGILLLKCYSMMDPTIYSTISISVVDDGTSVYLGITSSGIKVNPDGSAIPATINIPIFAYKGNVRHDIPASQISNPQWMPYGMTVSKSTNLIQVNATSLWSPTTEQTVINITFEGVVYPLVFRWYPVRDGDGGQPGRGIVSIFEQYYLSTSDTAQVGGSWQNSVPVWTEGKHVWTSSLITYSDSPTPVRVNITLVPSLGGTAITKIDVEYSRSQSTSVIPTTGWQTNAPLAEKGWYIWSRTKITYSNGVVKYSGEACISGADGNDGQPGDSVIIRYMRSENRPATPVTGNLNPSGWMSQIDNPVNGDIYWPGFVGGWTRQANGEYKSKAIEHNENSPLRFNFYNRTAGSELKLTVRTSSESYDRLHVGKLDEGLGENYANARVSFGGAQSQELTYLLPAKGEHYILFDYKKDATTSSGDDAAFVKIDLPIQSVWMTTCNVVGGVATAWSRPSLFIDNRIEETIAASDRSKAITDKFGTTIDGGLVQTVMMLLREAGTQTVTAGISGIQGINKDRPAFWAGGTAEQAVALIEFLRKMSLDITPDPYEYSDLAKITMLHDGSGKMGDLIVMESGEVAMVDPATGLERLKFNVLNLPTVAELVGGVNSSGGANIGAGSLTSGGGNSVALSGSTNVTKAGAEVTYAGATLTLTGMGTVEPDGKSTFIEVGLYVYVNNVRSHYLGSAIVLFTSPVGQETFESDTVVIPQLKFTLNQTGLVTMRLEKRGIPSLNASLSSAHITSSRLDWVHVVQDVRRQQFGLDGLMAFYSNNHLHFTEVGGLDVKGATNMPGVLCSGSVNSGGTMSKEWGAKCRTSGTKVSRPSVGVYDVYHAIGHDDYNVSVTAQGESLPSVVARYADYFVVNMRGRGQGELQYAGFDFQVFGRNY